MFPSASPYFAGCEIVTGVYHPAQAPTSLGPSNGETSCNSGVGDISIYNWPYSILVSVTIVLGCNPGP